MQDKRTREKLSRLRRDILQLRGRLEQLLARALARAPLVKGNVYEIARRCGTPRCRCTRGQLHRSMVLSWSEDGRHHLRSLPPAQVAAIRQKSEEYLRFRRARAEVSVILKKLLAVLDQIQELRCEAPRR
ncbi:MAG TPA: DUF6788 family protein [Terracidiphilus sp.]|nr:DUF6788 family protein [Terracidiphilus sp.]